MLAGVPRRQAEPLRRRAGQLGQLDVIRELRTLRAGAEPGGDTDGRRDLLRGVQGHPAGHRAARLVRRLLPAVHGHPGGAEGDGGDGVGRRRAE